MQILKTISKSFYTDSDAGLRWEGLKYPGFAVIHSGVQADEILEDAHVDRQLCSSESRRNQHDSVEGLSSTQSYNNTVSEESFMKRQWQG